MANNRRPFAGDIMAIRERIRYAPTVDFGALDSVLSEANSSFFSTTSDTYTYSIAVSYHHQEEHDRRRRHQETQRRNDRRAYDRAVGISPDIENNMTEIQKQGGRQFVVDVDASRKAALELIDQIVKGIPKEMEGKAEVKQLKKRVKILESQVKREPAIGQVAEVGTRSIEMEVEDD
jgi:hypothetical protein